MNSRAMSHVQRGNFVMVIAVVALAMINSACSSGTPRGGATSAPTLITGSITTPASQDLTAPTASRAPAEPPLYVTYIVANGDTLAKIAARFNISEAYILANNLQLQDVDFLALGQTVIIPPGNGILHEVRYGETLSDIAAKYNVNLSAITGFAPNRISTPEDLQNTQVVFVPNGELPMLPPLEPSPTPSAEKTTQYPR